LSGRAELDGGMKKKEEARHHKRIFTPGKKRALNVIKGSGKKLFRRESSSTLQNIRGGPSENTFYRGKVKWTRRKGGGKKTNVISLEANRVFKGGEGRGSWNLTLCQGGKALFPQDRETKGKSGNYNSCPMPQSSQIGDS